MDYGLREDVEHIAQFVTKAVPSAKLIEQRGSELVFVLPPNMRSKYEGLLTSLEAESPRLGIRSYGMSDTTLEEIFLKVTHLQFVANCIVFKDSDSSSFATIFFLFLLPQVISVRLSVYDVVVA